MVIIEDNPDNQLAPLFFDEIVKGIEKTKTTTFNYIPFSNFNRFKLDWSGIYKKDYCIITAGSSVGKSKLAFSQYVFDPLNFYNSNSNEVDIKIIVNALEEGRKKIFLSAICNLLAKKGIEINVKKLKGIPDTDSITNELIEKIKGLREWFDLFERKVDIYNSNKSTQSIFKTTKSFLENKNIGEWVTTEIFENGKLVKTKVYKEKNENLFVIHLTDHIGLLEPSKEEGSISKAIHQHSAINNLILRDVYNCQVVDVQQQTAEKEKLEFTFKGTLNEQKHKPSRDGLAENKSTYMNADQVIGLYAPQRFEITDYNNYNLQIFNDNYRYIEMLKARDGEIGAGIDVFFDGGKNIFSELPLTMTKQDYKKYGLIQQEYTFD